MDGIQSEHIHSSFEDILTSMKASTDNFTLTSANKLFVNKLFNLQEAFTQQTKKHYHVSDVSFKVNVQNILYNLNKSMQLVHFD